MVDEMELLRAAWPAGEPSPQGRRRAMQRLDEAMTRHGSAVPAPVRDGGRVQVRTWRPRWVLGAAAAAVLAVAATAIGNGWTGPAGRTAASPSTATEQRPQTAPALLLVAARTARVQPQTAFPRADQWVYGEFRRFAADGSQSRRQRWDRGDGRAVATVENGQLKVNDVGNGNTFPPRDYAQSGTIPDTPAQFLDWLRSRGGLVLAKPGQQPVHLPPPTDDQLFLTTLGLLSGRILTPQVEAAAYEALAWLPNISLVEGAVAGDGRPVLAVRQTSGGYQHDLYLDPVTYRYVGERLVAVEDVYGPENDTVAMTQENPPLTRLVAHKGEVLINTVRLQLKIVDEPGQT